MDYNLNRFIEAQETTYDIALSEIKNGYKQSHWMWFIFPQHKDLGRSSTAKFYGISDLEEAEQYLRHPILGERLKKISKELLKHKKKSVIEILGEVDALKLKSSMTLFEIICKRDVFSEVLEAFYDGKRDRATIRIFIKPIEGIENKYVENYLNLEKAYTFIRNKCHKCRDFQQFNAPDCGQCYISKLKYHIDKAITITSRLFKPSVLEAYKEYLANNSYKLYQETSMSKIDDISYLREILSASKMSCDDCKPLTECMGCLKAYQRIHLSNAESIIHKETHKKTSIESLMIDFRENIYEQIVRSNSD